MNRAASVTPAGPGTVLLPADRRWVRACAALIALAAVVAIVAGSLWWRADRQNDPAQRHAVEQAAATAVAEVLSFSPNDDPRRRTEVAGLLTGALAGDYLARGPDVVFPSAAASRITMNTRVQEVGVADLADTRARALVFAEQRIAVGDADTDPETVGIARWAGMIKEDGRWRLARIEPVSPQ